ncbi:UBX domain-containing protein [Haematococcus lacustris]|uniref:UBX domain-containing protein n=1 Tax=Haematococcus lacustris TaxID=44745 RepID=A0A699YT99_HAELA|nr:UBX domain-containing protein [Haematococcus lacustris]
MLGHMQRSLWLTGMVASGAMNTPTKGERALGLGGCPVPSHDDSFHMQQCVALILSHTTQPAARPATPAGQQPIQGRDQGTQAGGSQEAGQQAATGRPAASETLTALARILRNILLQPAEPKYRSIRLSNPKVAAGITAVPGAMELLEGCGFQLHFKQHSGVQPTGAAADPPATGADEGRLPGWLQVVLPVAPDMAPPPDWFFERTGAEVKSEWNSLGCFAAQEPVTAVWEYGELQYELITPARRPLPAAGCVRDVPDLLPAAVLNFRLLDSAGRDLSRMPMLSDGMLALTTTE